MLKVIAAIIKFFRKKAPALPDLDGVGSIAVKLAQQELKAAIAMEAALVASGGYVAFWLDPRRYDQPWDKWLLEPYPEPEPIRPPSDWRPRYRIGSTMDYMLTDEEWERQYRIHYADEEGRSLQDEARAAQQMAYDQLLQGRAAAGLLQSAANQHFHNIHRPTSKKRFDVRYGLEIWRDK